MNNEPNQQEEQQPHEEFIENVNPTIDEPVVEQHISEITNPQPENKDMEVHHHAHHGHEKKTWKSYFWEFFMLFLAVFCGSMAELQVEHYLEHKREKQYIASMIKDLETDTANLSVVIKSYETLLKLQDSVFYSFDSINHGGNKIFMRHLGYYNRGFPDFINADATIQQLKNAGGFRLLRNKQTVDSIIAYTADINKTSLNTNLLGNILVDLNNFRSSFINYPTLVKASIKGFDLDKLQEQKLSLFISEEKAEKEKLYGKLLYYSQLMKSILQYNFIPLKQHATSLISFLQKEYNLEH